MRYFDDVGLQVNIKKSAVFGLHNPKETAELQTSEEISRNIQKELGAKKKPGKERKPTRPVRKTGPTTKEERTGDKIVEYKILQSM